MVNEGPGMQTDDQSNLEIGASDRLLRLQAEFLVLSFIGVGASTIYGSWVVGNIVIPGTTSSWQMVSVAAGAAAVLFEWYLFRVLARAVLADRLGEFLPGLGGREKGSGRDSRVPTPLTGVVARLLVAASIVFVIVMVGVSLVRFVGLLSSVAVFSMAMLILMSVLGMLTVLKR